MNILNDKKFTEDDVKAEAYEIALHKLKAYIESGLLREEYKAAFKVARMIMEDSYVEAFDK